MNEALTRLAVVALLLLIAATATLARSCGSCRDSTSTPASPSADIPAWIGLDRYSAANARAPGDSPSSTRVVFLGDSIMENWDPAGSFPGWICLNRGISAQTSSQMLLRFQADVIRLAPSRVVILAGINDLAVDGRSSAETLLADNLASMCTLASATGIRVYLASLLPVRPGAADGIPFDAHAPERIVRMNRAIAQIARRHGARYMNIHDAMSDSAGLMPYGFSQDGLHPNAEGYRILAALIRECLDSDTSLPEPS